MGAMQKEKAWKHSVCVCVPLEPRAHGSDGGGNAAGWASQACTLPHTFHLNLLGKEEEERSVRDAGVFRREEGAGYPYSCWE